jgi:hypothetical protein
LVAYRTPSRRPGSGRGASGEVRRWCYGAGMAGNNAPEFHDRFSIVLAIYCGEENETLAGEAIVDGDEIMVWN